ncbi:MAG: M15 family peptidase [Proteobacteria bacterium]|nr:M15 family peptidase [Pseudomonadota bacterium]
MPKFSLKSNDKLNTCHPLLQELFREVVKTDDCSIVEGQRSRRRQNQLFKEGKSKLKWPEGKHNRMPSEAVDVGPWIEGQGIPWDDPEYFYSFALKVQKKADELGIRLRWGGDWDGDGDTTDQTFNDLAHWELLSTEKEA